jgi:hypothetical protein
MFIDLIFLLWIQSLDVKFLRNNFQKQINDAVSDFTHLFHVDLANFEIYFWANLHLNFGSTVVKWDLRTLVNLCSHLLI